MANEKTTAKDSTESVNLADIAKQVEAMLANAKAEAEKIVADAMLVYSVAQSNV